ncbi:MAG: hypothetical protein AAF430_10165 [Myxococcota bacterium]
MIIRVLETLAFSSVWVALTAAALCAAVARILLGAVAVDAAVLAGAGTLVVYNVDRLRDRDRDRETTPARTDFVETHTPSLVGLSLFGVVVATLAAWRLPAEAWVLLAAVALLGLFHRRLKRHRWWKPFYISGAWTAVTVGLPIAGVESVVDVGWAAAIIGTTIFANVVASNLRDGEAVTARYGPAVPLRLARGSALLGLLLALLAPDPLLPLAFVPWTTAVVLLPFSPGERYGLVAVDGALLLGALGTLLSS